MMSKVFTHEDCERIKELASRKESGLIYKDASVVDAYRGLIRGIEDLQKQFNLIKMSVKYLNLLNFENGRNELLEEGYVKLKEVLDSSMTILPEGLQVDQAKVQAEGILGISTELNSKRIRIRPNELTYIMDNKEFCGFAEHVRKSLKCPNTSAGAAGAFQQMLDLFVGWGRIDFIDKFTTSPYVQGKIEGNVKVYKDRWYIGMQDDFKSILSEIVPVKDEDTICRRSVMGKIADMNNKLADLGYLEFELA